MCLPAVGILTAVSTGLGLIGQQQQAKAQAAMYNAQAQAADANKRISDRKQEDIAMQQLQERNKIDNRMRIIAGQNAAEAGSSGLTMNGTPLQLMAASYDEYQNDLRNWESNKNNAIYNEYLNGMNYQNEANSARAAAANAKRQGRLAMVGSILGGAASMAGLKAQYANGGHRNSMVTTYGGDVTRDAFTGTTYGQSLLDEDGIGPGRVVTVKRSKKYGMR